MATKPSPSPFSGISGFLKAPERNAAGRISHGRFACSDVQWTGEGRDVLATLTLTLEEVASAAENRLLWTDQDVQRGIRPGQDPVPPRELSLADGYPDSRKYIFDESNADDIATKLLAGERLFLGPLIWNLRPGHFEAYFDPKEAQLNIYSGKIYLPDSHHRHQAILKAVRTWREARSAYPRFLGSKQIKVEIYFLSREDEGNYFFDKNQRPRPTAMSKAFDLTTEDDLSVLAKKVIEKSAALRDNVNRVTDRLSGRIPYVVTLSTLREMMKRYIEADSVDAVELEGMANVAAEFYDMLGAVRPELGKLALADRRAARDRLIVDSATMMHGFAGLMNEYRTSLSSEGSKRARDSWAARLKRLTASHRYQYRDWTGDIFEKHNPLWRDVGVVKPSKQRNKLTVLNTGGARAECVRVLGLLLSLETPPRNLAALAKR